MIIREAERGGGVIVRAMKARQADSDKGRPAGLHFSSIVNDFVQTLYPLEHDEIVLKQRLSLYELGDIIEEILADELRKRTGFEKPSPVKFKGVWYSPDGYASASRTIDEVKSTRISCGKVIRRPTGEIDGLEEHRKLMKYVLQIKGYMHVWKAKRGRLHVVFLNGNWKPPFPDPRTFTLRPETSHELKDTWEQLMDHASERGMLVTS